MYPPHKVAYVTAFCSCYVIGPICPQKIEETTRIYFPYPIPENVSDDCLYLNVWTPNIGPAAKLPVMVWIHGGTLQTGQSVFLIHDVCLLTHGVLLPCRYSMLCLFDRI